MAPLFWLGEARTLCTVCSRAMYWVRIGNLNYEIQVSTEN